MSDINLLMFGCGVTFIAISGAYVHMRRFFTSEPQKVRIADSPDPVVRKKGTSLD